MCDKVTTVFPGIFSRRIERYARIIRRIVQNNRSVNYQNYDFFFFFLIQNNNIIESVTIFQCYRTLVLLIVHYIDASPMVKYFVKALND